MTNHFMDGVDIDSIYDTMGEKPYKYKNNTKLLDIAYLAMLNFKTGLFATTGVVKIMSLKAKCENELSVNLNVNEIRLIGTV